MKYETYDPEKHGPTRTASFGFTYRTETLADGSGFVLWAEKIQ